MTKTDTIPIVMLTLQYLRDVIREEMGSKIMVCGLRVVSLHRDEQ